MGVEKLTTYINKNFECSYGPVTKDIRCDWVYVDINSILHRCTRSRNFRAYYGKLEYQLREIARQTQPRCGFVLCFDGPAPYAKILIQRERRNARQGRAEQKQSDTDPPSSLDITPGSSILCEIEEFCYFQCCKFIKLGWINQAIISGARVPGEGEVKISQFILQHHTQKPGLCHVIVADDSDLIPIALLSGVPNIFLLREDYEVYSIDALNRCIIGSSTLPRFFGALHPLTLDFSALVLLMGNDYLPKLKGFKIWKWTDIHCKIQQKLGSTLFNSDLSLNLPFFWHLCTGGEHLEQVNSEKCDQAVEEMYGGDIESESEDNIYQYLKTLLWNLEMYVFGSCQDYTMYYPYHSAPVIIKATKVLFKYMFKKDTIWNNLKIQFNPKDPSPVLPKDVLLIAIPKLHVSLIPEPLHPLFRVISHEVPVLIPRPVFKRVFEEVMDLSKTLEEESFTGINALCLKHDCPKIATRRYKNQTSATEYTFTTKYVLNHKMYRDIISRVILKDRKIEGNFREKLRLEIEKNPKCLTSFQQDWWTPKSNSRWVTLDYSTPLSDTVTSEVKDKEITTVVPGNGKEKTTGKITTGTVEKAQTTFGEKETVTQLNVDVTNRLNLLESFIHQEMCRMQEYVHKEMERMEKYIMEELSKNTREPAIVENTTENSNATENGESKKRKNEEQELPVKKRKLEEPQTNIIKQEDKVDAVTQNETLPQEQPPQQEQPPSVKATRKRRKSKKNQPQQ